MSNLPSKANASTHSLQEREEHREWIGGRALTLLSHYWRDDDPVELTAAIGQDWADVLEGLPQEYIQCACIRYQRDEPRKKPTPGAVYQLVKEIMPKPERVYTPPPPLKADRATQEQAEGVLRKAGVKGDADGKVVGL